MLWYKNWFEIRWGALYIMLVWIGLAAFFVSLDFLGIKSSVPNLAPNYGFVILTACYGFVFLAGSGVETHIMGLMSVPSARTTVYTLSLPVTRRRLVLTRSAVGLAAVIVANLPFELFVWDFLLEKATIYDLTIPFLEVTIFGVCMYCLVTLLSTIIRGGLLIPVAFTVAFVCLVIATGEWAPPALQILTVAGIPIGTRVPIPWLPMIIYLVVGAIFLFTAIKIVDSRDY